MKNEAHNENTGDLGEAFEVPRFFHVVIYNDDFTPMEFVVTVLEKFFSMDRRKASYKMLEAHTQGKSICGMFTKDVAESKIVQVMDYSKLHQHPFNCSIEAE